MSRLLSVTGARVNGRWRVRIFVGKQGADQPLTFTGEAYSLAFAIAQATYEAISEGEKIDGSD